MSQHSDSLEKFLSGDPKVVNEIYKNSFTDIEKYILSRGGFKKDAEDVFHNGLIHIYVKVKNGELEIRSLEKYLFTVCRNLWRKEAAKKRVTNIDDIPLISEEMELGQFDQENQQWELYIEKFDRLGENCKELLSMIFGKTPYEEIVNHFSYSSQTVARQRVFKCKNRLVKLIKLDNRYKRLKNNK